MVWHENKVKRLGKRIDNVLTFHSNILNICSKTNKKLVFEHIYFTPFKKVVSLVKSFKNLSYGNFSHRNASYQTLVAWPYLQYNLSHVIKFCW